MRRLKTRCSRRGTLEADLLLGGFFSGAENDLSDAEIAAFESVLDESDIEIYRWIAGQTPAPKAYLALIHRIQSEYSFKI